MRLEQRHDDSRVVQGISSVRGRWPSNHRDATAMSFHCIVPGHPPVSANAFKQVASNRWIVTLECQEAINEVRCDHPAHCARATDGTPPTREQVVAFVTEPLEPSTALGCHIASPPFEESSWHYLGAITAQAPSVVFKTRLVWTARDALPTCVQFGIELQPTAQLAARPAEMVSVEVLEAGRRIGKDLYEYVASFAAPGGGVPPPGSIVLPSNVFERWLARFNDKCARSGLDWLYNSG